LGRLTWCPDCAAGPAAPGPPLRLAAGKKLAPKTNKRADLECAAGAIACNLGDHFDSLVAVTS